MGAVDSAAASRLFEGALETGESGLHNLLNLAKYLLGTLESSLRGPSGDSDLVIFLLCSKMGG